MTRQRKERNELRAQDTVGLKGPLVLWPLGHGISLVLSCLKDIKKSIVQIISFICISAKPRQSKFHIGEFVFGGGGGGGGTGEKGMRRGRGGLKF